MARARARVPKPPRGLSAEAIELDGENLIVFSWSDTPEVSQSPPETLSAAELDVLKRIVRGDTNAQIARARKSAVRTVANQVASLLRKTGAASRYELIQRYSGAFRE
jgi:DNA-binding NarL/FixJ family response regulator